MRYHRFTCEWSRKNLWFYIRTEFKWRIEFTLDRMQQKTMIYYKNALNKCSEFSFLQKTLGNISISLRCGARCIQRLPFLKYFNALEWTSTFTLRMKATKNIKDIKKCLKQELFIVKFPTKNSLNAYLHHLQE